MWLRAEEYKEGGSEMKLTEIGRTYRKYAYRIVWKWTEGCIFPCEPGGVYRSTWIGPVIGYSIESAVETNRKWIKTVEIKNYMEV
jgi:hypothetical protein